MQRNLLSVVIAGAVRRRAGGRPGPGQAVGHAGRGHGRPDHHRHRLAGRVQGRAVPRPVRRRAVGDPAARPGTDRLLDRLLRRELRPRRHVHQPARRPVRRLQVPAVHRLADAEPPVQRPHAVQRSGQRRPARDVPAAQPRHLEFGQHRVRPPRHRRLLRVAAQLALVLPRGRQLRRARRHQDRLLVERDQPRQRLHRPDHSGRLPDDQRLGRVRVQHAAVPLRRELHGQHVRQRVQDGDLEQPVLGERHRHHPSRPGQRVPAAGAERHDPPAALELDAGRAVHLGSAGKRHDAGDDGA